MCAPLPRRIALAEHIARIDGQRVSRHAHIDYETFSEADLPKVGHYRYAEHESTEILMCSYHREEWAEDDIRIWVPAEGEAMPVDLAEIFTDQSTVIVAWNAPFERAITANCLPMFNVPISRWRCAMVDAMAVGFPGKLEQAGPAAGLPEELFKQEGGRKLINKFCKPRKPTKKNPAVRWLPSAAPEEWATFKAYCRQDVRSETAIWKKLATWRLPSVEQRLWEIDQEINDRGIQVDLELARAAHEMGIAHREKLVAQAQELTGLDNPNSTKQLIEWLNSQDDFDPDEDDEVKDLRKKTVEKILGRDDLEDVTRKVLELRQQIAKSSLKKYETILRATCDDGRIRGTLQFYGANRTGRWAGRLLQVQNLPQGIIEDVDLLRVTRDLVKARAYDELCFMFGFDQIPNVLATLIRSCLISANGTRLVVADLSAIEARVTAWFAKCEWRLEVFRTHGMIYEASASQMFKLPFQEFIDYKKRTGKHHPYRKKGKVSELALGYQGGENALVTMGALEMGLKREELAPMVEAWRAANPEIAGVKPPGKDYPEGGLWRDVENAAKKCLNTKTRQEVAGCVFRYAGGMLIITLPSGRHLHYLKAYFGTGGPSPLKQKKKQICYKGVDQKTKRWGLLNTYGGKLCIAKNTPVLTRRGWVPIQEVAPLEEVWDGEEWVEQAGAIRKGVKGTIKAHGVRMTPDHEILTDKGWKHASQSQGHNRTSCRIPDGYGFGSSSSPADLSFDFALQSEEVFDLLDCGPRHRFVVADEDGQPLIVHNCENIVQAFSRDILREILFALDEAGYHPIMLVHDEAVFEERHGMGSLREVLAAMSQSVRYALGLPLKGDGFENDFYMK